MTNTALSVIMPARNASAFIDEALRSIVEQDGIEQTALELIVIDDGSSDDTATRARAHPQVTVLKGASQGIAAARNLGLRRATAPLVTFLDADDRWPALRLHDQLNVLARNPGLDFVLGRTRQFFDLRRPTSQARPTWAPSGARHCLLLAAACFRRHLFESLGEFDEGLSHCEDVDLFLRAFDAGCPHERLDGVHLERRIHRDNHSHAELARERGLIRALASSIHRQQQQPSPGPRGDQGACSQ